MKNIKSRIFIFAALTFFLLTLAISLSPLPLQKVSAQASASTANDLNKYVAFRAVEFCFMDNAKFGQSMMKSDTELASIIPDGTWIRYFGNGQINTTPLFKGNESGLMDCQEAVKKSDISGQDIFSALGFKESVSPNNTALKLLCFETTTCDLSKQKTMTKQQRDKAVANFRSAMQAKGYPTTMTDSMKWMSLMSTLKGACKANIQTKDQVPEGVWNNSGSLKRTLLDDKGVKYEALVTINADDLTKPVGPYPSLGFDSAGYKMQASNCQNVLDDLTNDINRWASALAQDAKNGIDNVTGATTVGADGAPDPCAGMKNEGFSWLACGVITAAQKTADGLGSLMNDFLYTNTDVMFGAGTGSAGFKKAFNVFRNLALVIIVIAGLVMIISQAMGLELLDAYTIRKLLPKLGVALIGILLAWPLLQVAVTLSNNLAYAVRDLLDGLTLATAAEGSIEKGGSAGAIGGIIAGVLGGAGLAGVLGVWGAILLIISLIISFITGLIVLAIQKILLFVFILITPLAIAANVLPGTDKLWKFWKSQTIKLLAMFVVIMFIIKIGDFIAVVAIGANNDFMGAIAKIATLVATFKAPQISGQMMGGLAGMVAATSYKLSGAAKAPLDKMRQQGTQKRLQYFGGNLQRRASEKAVEAQRRLTQYGSREDTGRIGRFISRTASKRLDNTFGGYDHGRNLEARMSAYQAQESKKIEEQIATGDDRRIRGLTVNKAAANRTTLNSAADSDGNTYSSDRSYRINKGVKQYRSLGGSYIDEADVDEAYKEWGNNRQVQQAALSYELRKASADTDVQRLGDGVATKGLIRDAWGVDEQAQTGMWKGAAFQNQGQHLHLKYTNLDGKLDYKGYANELHQRKSVGQMSQFSGESIDQMVVGYNQAVSDGDQQAQDQYKGTIEAFMQRYGGGPSMLPGEDGKLQPTAPIASPMAASGFNGESYRSASYGAADVSEKVRAAAVAMGVYAPLGSSTDARPSAGTTYDGPRQG